MTWGRSGRSLHDTRRLGGGSGRRRRDRDGDHGGGGGTGAERSAATGGAGNGVGVTAEGAPLAAGLWRRGLTSESLPSLLEPLHGGVRPVGRPVGDPPDPAQAEHDGEEHDDREHDRRAPGDGHGHHPAARAEAQGEGAAPLHVGKEPDGALDEGLVLPARRAAARPREDGVAAGAHRLVHRGVSAAVLGGPVPPRGAIALAARVPVPPIQDDIEGDGARWALPERDGQVTVQRRVAPGHDAEVACH